MTEAVNNDLSQKGVPTPVKLRELKIVSSSSVASEPQNPDTENHIAPGVYETKFDRAQATVKKGGYSTAHAIYTILDGVHLESDVADRSRPVIDAVKKGLIEAQIATQAKLGKEISGAEKIQQLRGTVQGALNKDTRMLRRVSEVSVPDVNPAPFMVDAVAEEFDCGKEVATAKIVTALEDAQVALMRDAHYPKKENGMPTDFWILSGAHALGRVKGQFIANCGVEISKDAVGKATKPVNHEAEGELIPLVTEIAHQKQRQG